MRAAVALAIGIAFGIFAFAAGSALSGSWLAALLIAALTALLVSLWVWRHPVVELDETACSRGLYVLSGLATVMALVLLARLTVFMVDPSQPRFSFLPSSSWEVRHSCVSAYYVAAKAAGDVPNLYSGSLYTLPDDDPAKLRKARTIGPFGVDVFEYPPPFLVVPRALRLATPEFTPFRALWFALNGGFVLFAMLVVARRLGPTIGTRALLLSPFVLAALPTLSTLQKGNVQAAVIALSMVAMALFEGRRFPAGGALLAYATVSKLYPGMLVLYLLVKRQWRALFWTALFGGLFVIATFLDLGLAPYRAFVTHLPGLLGGEAFPAFRNPTAIAINLSIPGLVFKLKLFGVQGMSFGVTKLVGWIYTLVAVWLSVAASRRTLREDEKPAVWMAILILATLRSPFLPQAYGAFPPLWLLALVAAVYAPTAKTLTLFGLTWLALNVFWPMDSPMDPRLLALLNTLPQTVTIGIAIFALGSKSESVPLEPSVEGHLAN